MPALAFGCGVRYLGVIWYNLDLTFMKEHVVWTVFDAALRHLALCLP